jgi:phosphoribosylformimino-5-aminoimidazole carboxamide ribotide isomerase
MGIDKIILGTVAVFNPALVKEAVKKYKGKIILAIDVYNDKIAIGG